MTESEYLENVIKTERYGTVWGSPVQVIQTQCEAAA